MVSVIIPYDIDRGYLKEAIRSVKAQTYGNWELIVERGECRLGQNLNNAILGARGEYIKVLAEDDLLTPDSLKILRKGIKSYDFVYSDAENFGDLKGWPERSNDKTVTLESMLKGNGIHGGTTLYRKDVLIEAGCYDDTLCTGEEYDLHLKLIKNGCTHRHIPGIVYRYRLHASNKSAARNRHGEIQMIKQRYV